MQQTHTHLHAHIQSQSKIMSMFQLENEIAIHTRHFSKACTLLVQKNRDYLTLTSRTSWLPITEELDNHDSTVLGLKTSISDNAWLCLICVLHYTWLLGVLVRCICST